MTTDLPHTIAAVIEQFYEDRRIPAIYVNALHPGVVVPQFVRDAHGKRLVITLAADLPLELAYEKEGLSATLAFKGVVERCMFPWRSIYGVFDYETKVGALFEQHVPTDEPPPIERPNLRVIKGGRA